MPDQEPAVNENIATLGQQVQSLLEKGDLIAARESLIQLLQAQEEASGMFHESSVSSRLLMARLAALLGLPDESEGVLQPLQAIPDDNPLKATVFVHARGLVGTIRRLQGRMEEAFQLAGASLEFFDHAQKDPVNPDSFRALVQMIEIAREAGQYQQALDVVTQGIERFQGKVGEAHAHLILLAGSVLMAAEQYDPAREHFEGVLKQVTEQTESKHELAARAHYFLGQLEQELDADEKALEHFDTALKILVEIQGDPELATEINTILTVQRAAGLATEEAIKSLDQACGQVGGIFGPRSPRFAEISTSLAYHLRKAEQLDAARAVYGNALEIWRCWRPAEDPKITVLEKTMAELAA